MTTPDPLPLPCAPKCRVLWKLSTHLGVTGENKAVLIFSSDLGFFLKRVSISLQNMPALGEAKRESHGSEPPVFTHREICL